MRHLRPLRIVAYATGIAVVLPSPTGLARAVAAPAEEAAALYEEGEALYETSDYTGAVHQFTAAYKKAREIEDPQRRETVISALLFNLARAHKKAYGVDGDVAHLRQARELLLKHASPHEQEATASELLDEIEHELAALAGEPTAEDQSAAWEQAEPNAQPVPQPDPQPDPMSSPSVAAPVPSGSSPAPGRDRKTKGMTVAGIALMAASLGGAGLAIGGAVRAQNAEEEFERGPTQDQRTAAQDKGTGANVMIAVGVGLGAALLTTGAILVGVGAKKKASRTAVFPTFTPTFAGVGAHARF